MTADDVITSAAATSADRDVCVSKWHWRRRRRRRRVEKSII